MNNPVVIGKTTDTQDIITPWCVRVYAARCVCGMRTRKILTEEENARSTKRRRARCVRRMRENSSSGLP